MAKTVSLVDEYFALSKKHVDEYGETTIVFMLVGVFFEVYAIKDGNESNRINAFSQICNLQVVLKQPGNANNILMAGFKECYLQKYVKKMLNANYTVVVYVQKPSSSSSSFTCKNEKNRIPRVLEGVYSPGTYLGFDLDLELDLELDLNSNASSSLTNNVACIWKETCVYQRETLLVIGMANVNIFTGESWMFEYKEKMDVTRGGNTLEELDRFLCLHSPSECIFISNFSSSKSWSSRRKSMILSDLKINNLATNA